MKGLRSVRVPSAAVVALLSVMAGVLFGTRVASMQDRATARYSIYTTALAEIEGTYVEPLDARCLAPTECGSDALIYDSIDGMLRTLDPHSTFYSPRDYQAMRVRQEGHYPGIGIQIQRSGDGVMVVALFEGSPAYAAGIRRGDVIVRVGDEDAKGWSTDDVVAKVKGPKGTSVRISLRRPNVDGLIVLDVPRDDVRIPSVRTTFMVAPGTGYVRLQDFAETTTTELDAALTKLKAAGMERLVLDLRDNPGGPLDQAINVASHFIKRAPAPGPLDMVVYTRGRIANSDEDYHVTPQQTFTDVPMVVLVDRGSASASEIVTGSIQDHDRGLVIGETTFGKSLVQSVFPISNGAALALTTGRYFTPSGRMIQRPWDSSFDEYETYGLRDQDVNRPHAAADLHYTDAGRKVYAGGGITPDHFVAGPTEGFNPTRFSRILHDGAQGNQFAGFAERFSKLGDDRPGARSAPDSYKVSPGMAAHRPDGAAVPRLPRRSSESG